jgi:hypothetical protein
MAFTGEEKMKVTCISSTALSIDVKKTFILKKILDLRSRVVTQNFSVQRRRNLQRGQTVQAAMQVGSYPPTPSQNVYLPSFSGNINRPLDLYLSYVTCGNICGGCLHPMFHQS